MGEKKSKIGPEVILSAFVLGLFQKQKSQVRQIGAVTHRCRNQSGGQPVAFSRSPDLAEP